MDLSALIALISIASIIVLGLSMRFSGTPRGGVRTTRQLPIWKTNTPPKVKKPRRWREQIYAGFPERDDEREAA